jgi:hypothetical protein
MRPRRISISRFKLRQGSNRAAKYCPRGRNASFIKSGAAPSVKAKPPPTQRRRRPACSFSEKPLYPHSHASTALKGPISEYAHKFFVYPGILPCNCLQHTKNARGLWQGSYQRPRRVVVVCAREPQRQRGSRIKLRLLCAGSAFTISSRALRVAMNARVAGERSCTVRWPPIRGNDLNPIHRFTVFGWEHQNGKITSSTCWP